tara:strand:- start:1161 stop:1400 length:240 start_codon:yes stop_codon:yes gene_type:complete
MKEKQRIKSGDLVALRPAHPGRTGLIPMGKVLNVATGINSTPVASVIWSDNDRVEAIPTSWLEVRDISSVWEVVHVQDA